MLITNEQLNNYLLDTLNIVQNYDTILHDVFLNLYKTGLRANELLENNRWTALLSGNVTCTTEKGSNIREFTETELTFLFYTSIINSNDIYYGNSYSTCLRYFLRYRTFADIFHNNKSLNLSLFRHNKCKLLHDSGQSDTEIQTYLCEKDIRNSNNYIYSQLTQL